MHTYKQADRQMHAADGYIYIYFTHFRSDIKHTLKIDDVQVGWLVFNGTFSTNSVYHAMVVSYRYMKFTGEETTNNLLSMSLQRSE